MPKKRTILAKMGVNGNLLIKRELLRRNKLYREILVLIHNLTLIKLSLFFAIVDPVIHTLFSFMTPSKMGLKHPILMGEKPLEIF